MPFPLTIGSDRLGKDMISAPIPTRAGVGLKPQHYQDVLNKDANSESTIHWFEVHTENYMGAGGPPHFYLEKIRRDYPISMHGVGLSLGSADGLNLEHLQGIKNMVDRYQPALVSEHISWSIAGGVYLNDLIPMPYTSETLKIACDHIDQVQNFLGRKILVENPSSYLLFKSSNMEEPDFINDILDKTGCGLLLDVNNVFVSCQNHGWDAIDYLRRLKPYAVGEIHLAGHSVKKWRGQKILIDDHGSNVCSEVWKLYEFTLSLMGPKPTLIEWDNNIPSFMTLEQEAARTNIFLNKAHEIISQGETYVLHA